MMFLGLVFIGQLWVFYGEPCCPAETAYMHLYMLFYEQINDGDDDDDDDDDDNDDMWILDEW